MAYTLVDVVNKVARRLRILDDASDALTDFSEDRIRVEVNDIVDCTNDAIRLLYDNLNESPFTLEEGTITIATGDRDYAVPADFLTMASNRMVNRATGRYMDRIPEGYVCLHEQQLIPGDYEGQPIGWVIRPTDGQIYLDRVPTSEFDGDVYTYLYRSQVNLEAYDDTFPFSDWVVNELIPMIVQVYKRDMMDEGYDEARMTAAMAMATGALDQSFVQKTYER